MIENETIESLTLIAIVILITCRYYEHIITKKKLEEGDNIEDLVTPNSKREVTAIGCPNCRNLQKGEIIQLERKGYFIVDRPFLNAKSPIVLNSIPDK
mmetsp:Transcript_4806/g.12100  ORF Transcript_4806/g.12100 Transcript_4806/m.12100 type:complete len:98 (-) Transcript_4806:274-567(-)